MQQFSVVFVWPLFVAQHVSGVVRPIIRSIQLHTQPLVLHTLLDEGSSVVGRGRAEAACTVLCSWWWAVRRPKRVEPQIKVEQKPRKNVASCWLIFIINCMIYDMIYLLTAVGLSPGCSTHLHTNNTQNNTNNNRTTQIQTNVEECGPCPVFASFTLAFALQQRKRHGETSVRVRKTSVRLRKTSVRVQEKPRSEYKKNLSQNTRKTSVKVQEKPRSEYKKNLSQNTRKTSVRVQEKPQPG